MKPKQLRFAARCLGAALLLFHATSVFAAPSAQERERARALMDLGDARFEAKDYAGALEQYRGADEIMGVPTTGIEVGRTLERMGRLLEAREVLRRVSEFPQRPDEPKPFANARQRADRLLGDIAPRIPRVTLEVTGLPPAASFELAWDGQRIDPARIGGYLEANPGAHRVVGSAPGFPPVVRDVRLAEGQALSVTIAFGQTTQEPPRAAARTPPARQPPAPPPAKARQTTLFWVGAGVAVAGVTAGSIAGVRSLSLASNAKQHCDGSRCAPEAEQDISSARTWANVSNVAFGVGVAAVGVGVWQWLSHRRAEREPPRVQASLGMNSVGVWGSF